MFNYNLKFPFLSARSTLYLLVDTCIARAWLLVSEVFEQFRLLQTVLFLTYSVFFALCACFDDSMVFFEEFLQ